MQLVFGKEELAKTLGYSTRRFDELRRELEQNHGFPAPVPGLGCRWSIIQVSNWINRNETNSQMQAGSNPPIGRTLAEVPPQPSASISDITARLEQRYGGR
jgi:hypothetical protein